VPAPVVCGHTKLFSAERVVLSDPVTAAVESLVNRENVSCTGWPGCGNPGPPAKPKREVK